MNDLIDRQAAIDAIYHATADGDKAEWCVGVIESVQSAQPEKAQLSQEDTTSDCISRQSAINIVFFECGEWEGLAKTIVKDINGLPPAQPEQHEIVRCKNCKYFRTYYQGTEKRPVITHTCLWFLDRIMGLEDYCSKGEPNEF